MTTHHAPCPHAPQCTPCPLRGTPYRGQLGRKREIVTEALAEHRELEGVAVEPVEGSPDLFGYRTTVKLVIRGAGGGRLRAGVYHPGTHELVDAHACDVHHPEVNRAIAAVLRIADKLAIEPYDERSRSGRLRYLLVRHGSNTRSTAIGLVTATENTQGLGELASRVARRLSGRVGVAQNVNPTEGNAILGPKWRSLSGKPTIVERIGNLRLGSHLASFWQANRAITARLYARAVALADPGPEDTVLDLYTGVGGLALHLAMRAGHVHGFELAPQAVADARSNARRNGFSNARFHVENIETGLPALATTLGRVDAITLNPPRRGADLSVLEAIATAGPRRIVYVSCDPATLARDLASLARLGWRTTMVVPFDMMPQTEHVEVVARLERA